MITKRSPFHALAVLALTTATCLPAMSQSIRPGLWSIENKVGGNPEMEKAMALSMGKQYNEYKSSGEDSDWENDNKKK